MDLADMSAEGAEMSVVDPITGYPLGWTMQIAGPYSLRQRRARAILATGDDDAEARALACVILDWSVEEDGAAVPFTDDIAVRLLKAGPWLREQILAFVDDLAGNLTGDTHAPHRA